MWRAFTLARKPPIWGHSARVLVAYALVERVRHELGNPHQGLTDDLAIARGS